MTDSYWDRIRQEKELHRAKMAEFPFEEKLRVLERLRERAQALSGRHQPVSATEREPASHVRISNAQLSKNQSGSGAIDVGVLSANATLIVAKMPAQSSACVTTNQTADDTPR